MSLALIGAGLGRTGTLSLKAALERLGFGPCYHMLEILRAPERGADWVAGNATGTYHWDAIFAGYRATVDWPAAAFWRELRAWAPDAKVILSRRDPGRWHRSVMDTIYPAMRRELPDTAPQAIRDFSAFVRELVFERTFGGRLDDREHAMRVFEAHTAEVVAEVPADRLLVYEPGQGWEPLCAFLGVAVPDEPFPHRNDTTWYRERIGLPSLESGS